MSKDGYARIAHVIVRQFGSRIGPAGGVVYLSLASHADRDGRAWPSIRLIASEWGIGKETVRQAILRLEALGLIRVDRRDPRFNVYTVTDIQEPGELFARFLDQKGVPVAGRGVPVAGRGVPVAGRGGPPQVQKKHQEE